MYKKKRGKPSLFVIPAGLTPTLIINYLEAQLLLVGQR